MTVNGCHAGHTPARFLVSTQAATLGGLRWANTGAPVVLLHGITSSAAAWWRVGPALAALGYDVYALDMPGHGMSATVKDHVLDAIADVIGAALGELALTGVALIGHSWGGATALCLASRAVERERLARVALLDPALALTPERGAERLPEALRGIEGQSLSIAELQAQNPRWHPCDAVWKAEALGQCRASAVRGFYTQSGSWSLAERFAEVSIPLLLLIADVRYTVIPPPVLAASEAALRPGLGRRLQISGSDHSMQRSAYEPTLAALSAWLAE